MFSLCLLLDMVIGIVHWLFFKFISFDLLLLLFVFNIFRDFIFIGVEILGPYFDIEFDYFEQFDSFHIDY